jgi:hypothetical protein
MLELGAVILICVLYAANWDTVGLPNPFFDCTVYGVQFQCLVSNSK